MDRKLTIFLRFLELPERASELWGTSLYTEQDAETQMRALLAAEGLTTALAVEACAVTNGHVGFDPAAEDHRTAVLRVFDGWYSIDRMSKRAEACSALAQAPSTLPFDARTMLVGAEPELAYVQTYEKEQKLAALAARHGKSREVPERPPILDVITSSGGALSIGDALKVAKAHHGLAVFQRHASRTAIFTLTFESATFWLQRWQSATAGLGSVRVTDELPVD